MWTAATLVLETLPFVVTEVCQLKESDTVYFYLPAIAITLVAFPFITRLSERYGMKAIYRGSLLAGAISLPGLMLIGDGIPIPLLAQGIIWVVLQSASLAGAQILPSAMIAPSPNCFWMWAMASSRAFFLLVSACWVIFSS
jgi:Na+/melibiose symporter-like transporter